MVDAWHVTNGEWTKIEDPFWKDFEGGDGKAIRERWHSLGYDSADALYFRGDSTDESPAAWRSSNKTCVPEGCLGVIEIQLPYDRGLAAIYVNTPKDLLEALRVAREWALAISLPEEIDNAKSLLFGLWIEQMGCEGDLEDLDGIAGKYSEISFERRKENDRRRKEYYERKAQEAKDKAK
jgi:hypothetical protein